MEKAMVIHGHICLGTFIVDISSYYNALYCFLLEINADPNICKQVINNLCLEVFENIEDDELGYISHLRSKPDHQYYDNVTSTMSDNLRYKFINTGRSFIFGLYSEI